jgi:hypothetical protein
MGHTVGERSRKKVDFCVVSVVVTAKCFYAWGYREYYFRSGSSASEGDGV